MMVKQRLDESMKSYVKHFSNIHSQIHDPTENMAIQGFKTDIYDQHINLIIGSKG